MTHPTPTAVITGATSDIGMATAKALAKAGYALLLGYFSHAARAKTLAADLRKINPSIPIDIIKVDVRVRDEVTALFERGRSAFGSIDVLINNAGINKDVPFLEMTDDDWRLVLDTVLSGSFYCAQTFARQYTGTVGNIVNIGAITAFQGRRNGANYCSARAAVLTLTKCLALELAPNIRVNTVTPGRIDTEELRHRYAARGQILKDTTTDIPLGHVGHPRDVADMIAFIIRDGQYLTGQNFIVDGGLHMR